VPKAGFELRPDYLESEGLNTSLNRLGDALRRKYGFDLQLDLCPEPDLELQLKETLYRICHEALWNTSKHSQAKKVNVRLCRDNDWVALDVEDDGVGFDPAGAYPGHLGLQFMRERATNLGGNLEILSRPSSGTWVRARIPLLTAEKTSHELH
jgi:signal transduction histidine kinase